MADDGAWADVFAAMAGEEISCTEPRVNKHSLVNRKPNKPLSPEESTSTRKRKKTARHRKNGSDTGKAFLRSRTDRLFSRHILNRQWSSSSSSTFTNRQLPGWKLGGLIVQPLQERHIFKGCTKYELQLSSQEDPHCCICQHCGNSPLCHGLELEKDNSDTDGSSLGEFHVNLQLFILQRNIRALISWMSTSEDLDKLAGSYVNEHSVSQSINKLIHKCHVLLRSSSGSSSLQEKLELMTRTAKQWETEASHQCAKSINVKKRDAVNSIMLCFDARVKTLIATDDFYYSLYYEQLELSRGDDGCNSGSLRDNCPVAFIPHPHVYFAVPGLAWSCINVLKQQKGDTLNGKEDDWLFLDPLASLHSYRLHETKLLFLSSGWCTSSKAIRGHWEALDQHNSRIIKQQQQRATKGASRDSLNHDNRHHETPAHPLLASWRDSCRDFATHLYGYATLPRGSYSRIFKSVQCIMISFNKNKAEDEQQQKQPPVSFIEIGAGTGYLAYHLSSAGGHIFAFDSSPLPSIESKGIPNTTEKQHTQRTVSNEYHGNTPTIFDGIQKGTHQILKSFQFTQSFNTESSSVSQGLRRLNFAALVLCYPPPMNAMGVQSVQFFVDGGGQCVVHIGEASGLTGSPELEELLTSQFRCVDQWECLHWGTDAASVTIWKLKKKEVKSANHREIHDSLQQLALCSECLTNRAVLRCTFARDIAYCGSKCFNAHTALRESIMLDQYMLCLLDKTGKIGKKLDYNDPHHFAAFSQQ